MAKEIIEEMRTWSKFEFPLAFTPARYFYGHGKIMMTGEYLSLYGAKVLALPTQVGQAMVVRTRPSNEPKMFWKALDSDGRVWFAAKFELWHFEIEPWEQLSQESDVNSQAFSSPEKLIYLQKLLREARNHNPHFLRDPEDVFVETRLEFPISWGLGSSSSLIANLANWARVSPHDLMSGIGVGSGYDLACAVASGPILYQNLSGPVVKEVSFAPQFREHLYFVYRGNKQDTSHELKRFLDMNHSETYLREQASLISEITDEILKATDFISFTNLLRNHEKIIANVIGYQSVQSRDFADFWGSIKSLGAWGGDFMLAASDRSSEETRSYFEVKGYSTILSFNDLFGHNQQTTVH